jgi:hypothetical protein
VSQRPSTKGRRVETRATRPLTIAHRKHWERVYDEGDVGRQADDGASATAVSTYVLVRHLGGEFTESSSQGEDEAALDGPV